MTRRLAYLASRLSNSALSVLVGFVTTYSLIRVVGADDLGLLLIVAAAAAYLNVADLGVSTALYAHVRRHHVRRTSKRTVPLAMLVLGAYLAVALLSSLLAYGLLVIFVGEGHAVAPAYLAAFFLYGALNLPWLCIRSLYSAIDLHLTFDLIDFCRRLSQLVVIALPLLHLSLELTFGLLCLIWLLAFAVALTQLLRALGVRRLMSRRSATFAGRQFSTNLQRSSGFAALFSVCEFFTYNMLYVLVPTLYGMGLPLIVFDTYSKLFRGGIVANQLPSSVFLPEQTKAFHTGNLPSLNRMVWLSVLASVAVAAILSVALVAVAPWFFDSLLDGRYQPTPAFLAAIVIVLLGNAVQNGFGTVIVNLGFLSRAAWLAAATTGAIGIVSVAAWLFQWPIDIYLLAYSIIYAVCAGCWGLAWGVLRRGTVHRQGVAA